ncbi:MAG TPA: hypothetical protein VLJ11_02615 [Bryobacteraceae bacterium]|nr:hypothetical protein [Bryobacteraceae bacterium]
MSFLDNLENSLKSLESREERDPGEQRRKEDERSRARAAAPWAEQLKTSPYTQQLFEKAAIAGHRIRTKIYMAWIDSTLRLEAKGRRLELQPTPDGITASMVEEDGTSRTEPLDLAGKPEDLLDKWLPGAIKEDGNLS